MPFTLSHPAAVLPLLRTPFSRAALVAGAVAPDLPYFLVATGLPVSAQSWYEPFANATTTHTLPGALTVGLPYTLALWALLLAGRRPLAALLPLPSPAAPTVGAPGTAGTPGAPGMAGAVVRRAGWVLLSALIGLATHLVWDSFTHFDGFVVTRAPWLNTTLAGSLSWARALQHASTIGGLAAIAVFGWRRRARLRITGGLAAIAGRRRHVLLALALCTATGAVAHAWWWLAGPQAVAGGRPLDALLEGVLSDAAKGAGAGLIAALALYTAAWWARHAAVALRGRTGAAQAGTTA
ncbi:DUF4184 family protein [Kitasatospora sp. NPDC028055]|uniref:DUF4184 family protein n=1 Tax=Kitasatospora sp. NPDC028055 TaxID=3155653 RepID=UPI0033FC457D